MAYGDDITEAIPYTLSNPAVNSGYSGSTVAYDIAIGGQPFFLGISDESPYRRVTAQYRKQQIDQTREPGEQTLTGWWIRSQSTFHFGQGINFFEPAQDESLRFQYKYSKGCNIWTKGQVTLLNDVDDVHLTTGGIRSNGRPWQIARSIRWTTDGNTYDGILLADEYDVDKVFPRITVSINNKALTSNVATLTTTVAHGLCTGMEITITDVDATFNGTYRITSVPTTVTFTYAKTATDVPSTAVSPVGTGTAEVIHFIDYNTGTADPVYSICDDGVYAYWVTNDTASGKLEVNKKLLSADSTTAPTVMFNKPGITIVNAVIEYTKERIVLAANDKVYEFASSASSLPTAVYTHNDPDHIFTSITSSGTAIYLAGYSGIQSNIYKFTLSTNGTMPTLTSAITAAELPVGERCFKISYYLDYMAIGTSEGMRIAALGTEGSIAYGPLIFETTQPVYDFAFRDKYIWAASGVDGQAGVTRIDLGQQVGTNLIFAYAWDLYDSNDVLDHYTTTCAFLGDTNRLSFCNAGNGVDGKIYIETDGIKVPTAELRTGFIRYNTLENKIFKVLTPRFDTTNGGIQIYSVQYNELETLIGNYPQGANLNQIGIAYPATPQQYLGFRFLFSRNSTDSTSGPIFTGYQVNTLPSIPRQRLIQYPAMCYDYEMDKFNNQAGYDGAAYNRMSTLENIEDVGDTVLVQDFRTGESYLGLIEEQDFINKTPTDKRYSGYGGVLLITIRKV